ncbi:MAG: glycosyltransferase family 1 protein [Alphaproteobacteria bacterium]|nr:MAG: glycosyltransferase family 1 protein [Alphaproteobacteria bacterium]
MQILIDGDYARDQQGTGISTYARTLAKALITLGNDLSWLSGASGGDKREPLADAAAVADQLQPARGPRAWVQTAGRMAEGLSASTVAARKINRGNVVVAARSEANVQAVHLAPELYIRAHYRHMLLRQFTTVKVGAPVDVLHLTAPLPIRMSGVKRVVTIHDLIPIRLPYTTPDNKSEFIARARTCVRESDLVITVSEASKADIVNLLDVDPSKVAVTYQSSDLQPLTVEEQSRLPNGLSRFGIVPGEYLLCVGAQEPKKNVRRLIEAYLEIDTPMPLVLAGPRGWMWEQEVGAALAPLSEKARARLKFTGYIDRDDLRRLYAGACALVYPSLYEGFGLPALEAMISGCPVVTSNISSLPEVCGDAAIYVDPFDRNAIRQGIEQVVENAELRSQLSGAGRKRAQIFSFETYLTSLNEAYSRLSG